MTENSEGTDYENDDFAEPSKDLDGEDDMSDDFNLPANHE